ncbi:MAG: ABC transporter permease subunit [Halobacteriales archaeon]|nr:ABC transporter permease subunit [Halobacteriales archaeon]
MSWRKTLRIARWEVSSGVGSLDRRTIVLLLISLAITAALVPMVADRGLTIDNGIYRVGVAESNPYYEAIDADPRFAIQEPDQTAFDDGRLTVLITERQIYAQRTQKGQAAAAALQEAVERYNDRLMRAEPDRAAAFPVIVNVQYRDRELQALAPPGARTDSGSSEDSTNGGDGSGSDGGDSGASDDGSGGGDGRTGAFGGAIPSMRGSQIFVGSTSGSPSSIAPPFPFGSLVLAFAFVLPMNFVIQTYATSMLQERTNRRGEPMLVSPVSRYDIIAGKTLPYFVGMLAIAAATAVLIGGSFVSVLAVAPLALLFLASAFIGAMLARSHKELTFVIVAVSVFLTAYVFVPAIFTDVHPIAIISPLSLVVFDLQDKIIVPADYVFSTLPFYLTAGVLFLLGSGLYREEDLFAQVPLPQKFIDALVTPITRPRSAAWMSVLLIPFVLIGELLMIAVLFVIPITVSLPLLLVSLALVEEIAKSIHVYAGFQRAKYGRGLRSALLVGALSGAGFFFGEKLAIIAQLVGLPELELGRAAFETSAGIVAGGSPVVLVGLLLAPLALHTVTAAITALGASRNLRWYGVSLGVAILIHALYNLTAVRLLG